MLDKVPITGVTLTGVVKLLLQDLQQSRLSLLRRLSIGRHREKAIYFFFEWLH
jgi:hypothetical protein